QVLEDLRDVTVARNREAQAAGRAEIDEAGSRRRNHGVDVEQDRQPAQAKRAGDGGIRAEGARESELAPAVLESARIEAGGKGDGEAQVDDHADDHRSDHGKRDVAPWVVAFGSELDSLLEAQVGEDDAARERRED